MSKTPEVFDTEALKEKAVAKAKQTWSYNYNTIVATLKAVGKMADDETKIPEELVVPIKNAILADAIRIQEAVEKKIANGEPF